MLIQRTNGGMPVLTTFKDEMDRFFDRFWETKLPSVEFSQEMSGTWTPAINVTEENGKILVEAEVPGVDAKDIDVTVQDDMLIIKGEKEVNAEHKDKDFYCAERRFGSFMRKIQLPTLVDENKVTAMSTNGVLHIELTKSEQAQPKRVPVITGEV